MDRDIKKQFFTRTIKAIDVNYGRWAVFDENEANDYSDGRIGYIHLKDGIYKLECDWQMPCRHLFGNDGVPAPQSTSLETLVEIIGYLAEHTNYIALHKPIDQHRAELKQIIQLRKELKK